MERMMPKSIVRVVMPMKAVCNNAGLSGTCTQHTKRGKRNFLLSRGLILITLCQDTCAIAPQSEMSCYFQV
eukprot:2581683-Amphidinium_carterae.1